MLQHDEVNVSFFFFFLFVTEAVYILLLNLQPSLPSQTAFWSCNDRWKRPRDDGIELKIEF